MQSFRNLSVKWKLTWIIMFASATPLLLCCAAIIGYEILTFRSSMVSDLSSQAEIIGSNNLGNLSFYAIGIDTRDDAGKTLGTLRANPHIISAGIYTAEGKIFARYMRDGNQEDFPAAPPADAYQFTPRQLLLFQPVVQDREILGTVYIQSDLGEMYDRVGQYGRILGLFLIGAFGVAFILASVLQRIVSTPILQLAETMKNVTAQQDYSLRAAKTSDDEVGMLIDGFNEMLTQIEKRDEELEDYSHNLEDKVAFRTQELKERNQRLKEALLKLREMQNQIVIQQKLASLGTLTAGIAHEIKNPLNFVNNFAQLSIELTEELRELMEKVKDKLDAGMLENIEESLMFLEENIEKIHEHGQRADSIVRNMLLLSRGKPGERQEINLNALLDEYVALAYHGMRAKNGSFNATIHKEYDKSLGVVDVVPQDLSRVFLNILSNALYAMQEKKERLNGEFSPTLAVTTRNLGNQVRISIRDNGKGIPREHLDRIFNPFFTTKPAGEGTGLGLSISYDIIVQHKGEIKVDTEEGKYTEFIIILPKTYNGSPVDAY